MRTWVRCDTGQQEETDNAAWVRLDDGVWMTLTFSGEIVYGGRGGDALLRCLEEDGPAPSVFVEVPR